MIPFWDKQIRRLNAGHNLHNYLRAEAVLFWLSFVLTAKRLVSQRAVIQHLLPLHRGRPSEGPGTAPLACLGISLAEHPFWEKQHGGSIDLFPFLVLSLYSLSAVPNERFRSGGLHFAPRTSIFNKFEHWEADKKHIPLLLLDCSYIVCLTFVLKGESWIQFTGPIVCDVSFLNRRNTWRRRAIACMDFKEVTLNRAAVSLRELQEGNSLLSFHLGDDINMVIISQDFSP